VANIKSQIKRNRQNDKKRLRNRVYRGEARIAVKNARTTIEEGVPESKAALLEAISALDKAAEQGVIHKNNAARRKSRLVKAFNKMEPVKVEESAAVELVAEAEPVTSSPKGKKKAAPRKASAKKEEPVVEAAAEPKKKTAATSSPKGKKTTAKKPAAKKTEATSSPKGKKPTAKKSAAKKTTAKKTTAKK